MKKIGCLAAVVLVTFALGGNRTWAQPKEIRIGWIGPLTGPAAEAGTAIKQASILAMEECNAKGGIYVAESKKKLPLKILFEDCQSKPEVGVSLGEKFITRNKVHMLLADAFHSHVTMAVMELAPKYGIPIMSVEPISEEIAKKVEKDPNRYWSFWKSFYGTTTYGIACFDTYKFLMDQKEFTPKNKTICSIVEDTDYGRSSTAAVKEKFEEIGWKFLTQETVPLGHTDFYPQLTKIKALAPDILLTCFTALSSGVAVVKQFQEVGLESSHYAIFYPMRPEFLPQAGKAAEHLLWCPWNLDIENIPAQKELSHKVRKRWNVSTNYDHVLGYDGVNNAIDVIERAASLDAKKIVEALSKLDRKGAAGRYTFNQANHQGRYGPDLLPCPTAQVFGGKSSIIWPIDRASQKYVRPPWLK